eukprot:5044718-Pyramimonas_sp.AAC.1
MSEDLQILLYVLRRRGYGAVGAAGGPAVHRVRPHADAPPPRCRRGTPSGGIAPPQRLPLHGLDPHPACHCAALAVGRAAAMRAACGAGADPL